jgi:hypothetical protein
MSMPYIHMLHEALTLYSQTIFSKIQTLIQSDDISHLNFTHDKIVFIINEINNKTCNYINITELKTYYRDYELESDDIININKILRRINNRHYAKKSRDKKNSLKLI